MRGFVDATRELIRFTRRLAEATRGSNESTSGNIDTTCESIRFMHGLAEATRGSNESTRGNIYTTRGSVDTTRESIRFMRGLAEATLGSAGSTRGVASQKSKQLPQPCVPAPAHRHPSPVAQNGHAAVFCVELDLFDAFDVEEHGAVDADEAVGVELAGEVADRLLFAQLRAGGVDEDGVVVGFYVIDAGDGDDLNRPVVVFDDDALQRLGAQ